MSQQLRVALIATAWLIPALIIIQAALTGQTWFAGAGLTGLHGGLGHAVLLLTATSTVASWTTRDPKATAVTWTVLLGLIIAQIGLGYSGHRAAVGAASALHIPLGVTIAIIATTTANLQTLRHRASFATPASQRPPST